MLRNYLQATLRSDARKLDGAMLLVTFVLAVPASMRVDLQPARREIQAAPALQLTSQ